MKSPFGLPRSCALPSGAGKILMALLGGNLGPPCAGLRRADGDGLLGVFHLGLRLAAALEFAPLELMHGLLHFFLRLGSIFARHDCSPFSPRGPGGWPWRYRG